MVAAERGRNAEVRRVLAKPESTDNPRIAGKEVSYRDRFVRESESVLRALHHFQTSANKAIEHAAQSEDIYAAARTLSRPPDPSDNKDQRQRAQQELYSWYQSEYPQIASQLDSLAAGEQHNKQQQDRGIDALHSAIANGLARMITVPHSLAAHKREAVAQQTVDTVAESLLQSPKHEVLRNVVRAVKQVRSDAPTTTAVLENVHDYLTVEEALAGVLTPDAGPMAFRTWVRENARESRQHNQRIFLTPYYEEKADEIREATSLRNGVGGALVYGPPGTGKTELLQEINKQEGWKTRVISMHYYSSFSELVASPAIHMSGLPDTATVADKISYLQREFSEHPDQFRSTMESVYATLSEEGKAKGATLNAFLASIVSTSRLRDEITLNADEPLSRDLWDAIREDYFTNQRAQLLRSTLGSDFQKAVDEVVDGEIIEAINEDQRVILDEVDKAGPNSLPGLLGLLGRRPGDTITFGNRSRVIPDWFRIDATSNEVDRISEPFRDRFKTIKIDTPPVTDQLRIAAVLGSDIEGNMLLNQQDQTRLVAFFTFVVPSLNKTLTDQGTSPLSNRFLYRLMGALVDFTNMQRTDTSFEAAVTTALHQQTDGLGDEKAIKTLEGILSSYRSIITEPVKPARSVDITLDFDALTANETAQTEPSEQLTFDETKIAQAMQEIQAFRASFTGQGSEGATDTDIKELRELRPEELRAQAIQLLATKQRNTERRAQIGEWLQTDVIGSPIMQAIHGLPTETNNLPQEAVSVTLSQPQQEALTEYTEPHKMNRGASFTTAAGFIVTMKRNEITITGGSNFDMPLLQRTEDIAQGTTIAGASADGRVVLARNGATITLYSENGPVQVSADTPIRDAQITSTGEAAGLLRTDTLKLVRTDSGETMQIFEDVSRFQFSANGRYVLIESEGQTKILDLQRNLTSVQDIDSPDWYFAGDVIIGKHSSTAYYMK